MKDEQFVIEVNGQKVRGLIENKNSDKLMILVHGFTGDMRGPDNIFEKLSKRLQQKGFAVLRFNFTGTPPSGGEFKAMTVKSETHDLKSILKFAKSKGFQKIGILGESMGGTIAVTAYDPSLKIIIFWYPAFEFIDTSFKNYLSKTSKQKLLKDGFILESGFKIGKTFIGQINTTNVFDRIKDIKCSVLFLHGDKDIDVPYKQSQKAFKLLKMPKEIYIIKGADHCFKHEQEMVIDLTIKFLDTHFL